MIKCTITIIKFAQNQRWNIYRPFSISTVIQHSYVDLNMSHNNTYNKIKVIIIVIIIVMVVIVLIIIVLTRMIIITMIIINKPFNY